MSILEMVYRVADFWKLDKSVITASKSEAIKQPARRPREQGLLLKRQKGIGIQSTFI